MAQLVGQSCVRCGDRIPDEIDSRFCGACGSPIHDRCARTGGEGDCTACGAPGRSAGAQVPARPQGVQTSPTQLREVPGVAKDCPRCGLVSPPNAQRCDCGYDYVSRRQEQSYLGGGRGRGNRTGGVILLLLGCVALVSGVVTMAAMPAAGGPRGLGGMVGAILPGGGLLLWGVYLLRPNQK
jgi:hypothetical protein